VRIIRGDEPTGVIIHIYLEVSQGNSLFNYIYLKQVKMLYFLFFLFSSTKLESRRNKSCPGGRAGNSGR
jgi:hypothetical protein